jgi:hypothetical protein
MILASLSHFFDHFGDHLGDSRVSYHDDFVYHDDGPLLLTTVPKILQSLDFVSRRNPEEMGVEVVISHQPPSQ